MYVFEVLRLHFVDRAKRGVRATPKKKKGEEERQHLPPHPTPPSKKPINFPHYNDPYFNLQTVAYVAAAV